MPKSEISFSISKFPAALLLNMLVYVDQASTISQSALTASPQRVSARVVAGGLFLFALWFVLCRHLSSEWSVNEQYNYGWFVPFFAAYLFWLRWETRPEVRGQRSDVRDQASEI